MNPFSWSERGIRVATAAFFAIALPIYLYIGFQPNLPAEAASYPQMEIAAIGLKTPVEELELNGRQLSVPDMIAGAYSAEAGKTLIIGHSSTVFKKLDRLKVGETINYNDHTYEVERLEVVKKSDIDMSEILAGADTETLVLMTCAGESLPNQDATHRLIITATEQR